MIRSVALAINSAGQVVIAADNNGIVYPIEATGTGAAAYVYNMNTQDIIRRWAACRSTTRTIPTGTGTQYGGHAAGHQRPRRRSSGGSLTAAATTPPSGKTAPSPI